MWSYPETFDIVVIGGGHAGCEAAFACARRGAKTLLLTMTLDTIGKMSCNPAVGGVAKGHMVREIDALGGEMGKITDATGIQFRMLNATKGPAVWAPRAQSDRWAYQAEMKRRLEATPHLFIKQGTIESLFVEGGRVRGVDTKEGIRYEARAVILSSGTFLRGLLHIGETRYAGGRAGDKPAEGLSGCLERLGFRLGRLKTGTPPRIHRRSIDFSHMEEQLGDPGVRFSYDGESPFPALPQVACHITYTTAATKEVVQRNIHRSAMYSGQIRGVGPRYCPSIEDKIVRFADKERHQIFLEPEGLATDEYYVNGISSSLPFDVQYEMIHSVLGLEQAEIMRPAYAIEYDYVVSGQLHLSLETKTVEGLFLAGQINGTSGYEEAAGQGLMAGINAVNRLLGRPPLILKRSEAYIGVMIDDLVRLELDEPYRMFTSRAEHRLLLRQDNADLRLRAYGYELGLVDRARFDAMLYKKQAIDHETGRLRTLFKQIGGKGCSLAQMLCRPEYDYSALLAHYGDDVRDHGPDINLQIELALKYEGYLKRQAGEIEKLERIESVRLAPSLDYAAVKGLRFEAREKLSKVRPENLGQASRIAGVSPADISVLLVFLRRKEKDHRLKEE